MHNHFRILRSVLAAGSLSVLSCNQSSPPIVAEAVAVAVDRADQVPAVKEKPGAEAPGVAKSDPIPDGGSFPFPDDAGGKALSKSLAPGVPRGLSEADKARQNERRLPAFLNGPMPTLPDSASTPPRLPLPPIKDARPTSLPDRVPNNIGGAEPQLPARTELPTGPLTKIERRDPNLPAELPILSTKPVPDRAPLADPTVEFTAQSVISPSLPLRTEPTGFIRINLPDPFEHADAAKPRTPVVENPNRSLGNPPPPR
ncbi:MAG: hypothetical protein EXS09_06555 [Gemmataceae bacterium]|nr:hypothetical protein [Gemmataceae bacterium]